MITFACPKCGMAHREEEAGAGRKFFCNCGQKVQVPYPQDQMTTAGIPLEGSRRASARSGEWFYELKGNENGPATMSDLKHLVKSGILLPSTRVWTTGMSDWQAAEKALPALFPKPKRIIVEESGEGGGDRSASAWEGLGFAIFAIVAAAILAGLGYLLYTKIRDTRQEVAQKEDADKAKNNNAQGAQPLTADQVAEAYEKSVALITYRIQIGNQTLEGWGTGFLVAPDIIATNQHVIANAFLGEIQVSFPSSKQDATTKSLRPRLLYEDARRDLAFLKVPAGKLPALKLSNGQSRKGTVVYTIGSPGTGIGAVRSVNQINSGELSNPNWLDDDRKLSFHLISANINKGNSGGPVFDGKGEVIGVVVELSIGNDGRRLEGINRAIPSEAVHEALRTIKDKTEQDILKAELNHDVAVLQVRRQVKSK